MWIKCNNRNGGIFANKLYPHYKLPVVTSDRHFFVQCRGPFFICPAQPAAGRHQSGQGRQRLPWHSRCPLIGTGRGAGRGGTPDALRSPAGRQVPYRLTLAAGFDPCPEYASVAARFKASADRMPRGSISGFEATEPISPRTMPISLSSQLFQAVQIRGSDWRTAKTALLPVTGPRPLRIVML